MGYIYMVTNVINGKKYIGQTRQSDIECRWRQHKKISKSHLGPHLYNAYMAHGVDNFKFQIVCICFDEDCDTFEMEYIKYFNTLSPNGYNIKPGGKTSNHSKETIEKIREANTKYWTPERRARLSALFTGRTLDESQKVKLRAAHLNYWKNMTDEERAQKKKEASERGKNPLRYKSKESEERAKKGLEYCRTFQSRTVGQYNKDNVLVNTFTSIADACTQTGICRNTISKVCWSAPHYHTAGGYRWKFL